MLATLAWILTAVAAWCGLSIATVAAWVAWSRRLARRRQQRILAGVLRRIAQEDPTDPLMWPALWAAPESLRRKE